LIKKKLAIIGGDGSIGKQLVKHFGKSNIIILSSKKKKGYKYFNLNKEINELNLKRILHKVKTVIFCSSLKIGNNKKLYKFNFINFKNFLRVFKNFDKKLIYLSTISVYPKNTKFICTENTKPIKNNMAGNYYSYTKYLAEKEIIKVMKKKSFLILRIGAIYGLNNNSNFLERSLYSLENKKKILFQKPLSTKFNFLHIDQLVNSIDFMIKKNKFGIYNIGNYRFVTLGKLIENIRNLYFNPNIQLSKKKNKSKPFKFFINFSVSKLKNTNYIYKKSKKFLC
jgi:nucleoside-diphosphate-sugar epimerase